MHNLDQQYRNVLIFLIIVILAGSGYWMLRHFHPALFLGEPDLIVNPETDSPTPDKPNPGMSKLEKSRPEIVVHVTGAVWSPGVYRLSRDARVHDAIEKAGGATEKADIHRLNLAAKIRDGQQIYVPESQPPLSPPTLTNESLPRTSVPNSPTPTEESLINLNTATLEQLQTLPRIGPAMAQRIIEYRQTYGPFSSVDDLAKVKGIGEKTLERIRHLVVVH